MIEIDAGTFGFLSFMGGLLIGVIAGVIIGVVLDK